LCFQVYYHESYTCGHEHDIAILELGENVLESEATPICLPKENEEIYHNLKAIGAGLTGRKHCGTLTLKYPRISANISADEKSNPPDGQQLIHVTFSESRNNVIIVKTAPRGDSGGPLFQTNDEKRNVLMGVMSEGTSCEEHYEKLKSKYSFDDTYDKFTDVRQYLYWICDKTGVCAQN
ncbi:hypothetical protein COOONC_18015, partial [Cooperia oncophora]